MPCHAMQCHAMPCHAVLHPFVPVAEAYLTLDCSSLPFFAEQYNVAESGNVGNRERRKPVPLAKEDVVPTKSANEAAHFSIGFPGLYTGLSRISSSSSVPLVILSSSAIRRRTGQCVLLPSQLFSSPVSSTFVLFAHYSGHSWTVPSYREKEKQEKASCKERPLKPNYSVVAFRLSDLYTRRAVCVDRRASDDK